MQSKQNFRRISELDWVRVFVIFAVFLHHVGMPFNGDDWLIMNETSSKLLDDIMVFFEQFRLPILFLVAGAGASLLLNRRTAKAFAWDKVKRLFIPLLVGMLFINPPQLFFENPADYTSLWHAYPKIALRFESIHLWFIEYLLVFSILGIAVFRALKSLIGERLIGGVTGLSTKWWGLMSFGILVAGLRTSLKPFFPSDDHGVENLSSSLFYFFFFVMGMILMHRKELWQNLGANWKINTGIFAGLIPIFYFYYFVDFSAYASTKTLWSIWWGLCSLLAWAAALSVMGIAQRFLTKTPAWLMKANTLIYPFYILHQTVIVIFAYYIVQWQAGLALKGVALLGSAFLTTSAICVLVIYPFNPMRFLFGLKPKN